MKRRDVLIFLAMFALPIAGGCSSLLEPRSDPSKFYVLTPIADADSNRPGPAAARNLAIGLGPVKFPDYLQNLEVVTRVSANRIELSPTDRWAEPLDESFRRLLARNLAKLLNTEEVVPYPWYASTPLDYKIEVTVERFERDSSGGTQLLATWLIRDGLSDKPLLSRQSNFSESAGAKVGTAGSSMDGAVAALSADLSDLSRQIADTVTELNTTRPTRAAN